MGKSTAKVRLFLLFVSFLFPFFASAQHERYLKEGNRLFKLGRYGRAIEQYEVVLTLLQDKGMSGTYKEYAEIEKKIIWSRKAENGIVRANSFLKKEQYEEAKKQYKSVLSINPADAGAKKGIEICEEKLALTQKMPEEETSVKEIYSTGKEDNISGKNGEITEADLAEDMLLWQRTVNVNTGEAYENYLRSSRVAAYKNEAMLALCKWRDTQHWTRISGKGNIDSLHAYLESEVPCKQYEFEAGVRIKQYEFRDMLRMCENLYKKREYGEALSWYDYIRSIVPLPDSDKKIYEDCKAEITYLSIKKKSRTEELEQFVEFYPFSRHYAAIANRLAEKYADLLSVQSVQEDYDRILRLASDPKTIKEVKKKINKNKKKVKSTHKK